MGSWQSGTRLASLEQWRGETQPRPLTQTGVFWDLFPDTGPYRRELYPRHLEFFGAGVGARRRAFVSANRIGKTTAGCYELVCHMTGRYPDWWTGARFDEPVHAWACGETAKNTRDIVQRELLGDYGARGTGLIPEALLEGTAAKSGIPYAIELFTVRHISGGLSLCLLKSYDQGFTAFQGTQQHVVLLDEEPPLLVYTECLLRTMATGDFPGGLVLLTFTPLLGLSETVQQFLPDGQIPEQQTGIQYVVRAGWDDVPHLTEEEKANLRSGIPPYQLDARTRGIPVLGAGVIYPVPEEDYLLDDMPLPNHWRRAYALDVGWNRTAALWGAYDADTDIWYCYNEHYRGQAEPSIHAAALRGRGEWIPGVVDPAARGRSQADGRRLIETYLDLGLRLSLAQNAVEAGIYQVWERLSTGRLRIMRSCQNLRTELCLYRRDEKGRIIKDRDHLVDCVRYLMLSGAEVAKAVPVHREPDEFEGQREQRSLASLSQGWMG